jgi:hypothetical protein
MGSIKGEEYEGHSTVYCDEEPIGIIVDETTLTKKQLCEAIYNYGRCVVRHPDGAYGMIDPESNEYHWGPDVKESAAA